MICFDLLSDRQHLLRRELLRWFAGSAGNRAEEFLLPSRCGRPQDEKLGAGILKAVPCSCRMKTVAPFWIGTRLSFRMTVPLPSSTWMNSSQ